MKKQGKVNMYIGLLQRDKLLNVGMRTSTDNCIHEGWMLLGTIQFNLFNVNCFLKKRWPLKK